MKIEQRIGRLSRIGQTHDVHVFNLVAANTVEAAVLHLLEAKLNMFELVIGEVDMILGNLDDEREFQDVVADLWAESSDHDDFAHRIDDLGNRLLEAKRAYFEQRALDDKLFGNRFRHRSMSRCVRPGAHESMNTDAKITESSHSPLEEFLRDYTDVAGGMWDEVEPQVYDLMLPSRGSAHEPEMVRLVFDPEAIPEHPGSQLASYGTPLVDRLLADAVDRGRHLVLYKVGLNLVPQGLEGQLRRAVTLPSGFVIKIERSRPLHFPQAVFWFEATFVSDQKEQDLLTVAIDAHYGRQVRHLDRLLDRSHLAAKPWSPLAEAPHPGLAATYPIARDRVIRTLSASPTPITASSASDCTASLNASAGITTTFVPRWKNRPKRPGIAMTTPRGSPRGWRP